MGKKLLVFGVFALLIVFGLFFVYRSITSSGTVVAQLNVESGQVLVNGQAASDGTLLSQGDVVETGSDGLATVILYESILVSLESNTKISIDDLTKAHPQITQESGETWNKFAKLSGVEGYSVKTGNSVASVRGTAFGVDSEGLLVGEGLVSYDKDGEHFDAGEDEVVALMDGKMNKRMANAEDKAKIKRKMTRMIGRMQHMRNLEIRKNKFIVNRLKASKGWTDDDVKKYFEDLDGNNENVDQLVNQAPVKAEGLRKMAEVTKEIRRMRMIMNRLG